MVSPVTLAIVAVLAAIIYYFLKEEKVQGKLPPGPKGWPVIGNLLSLSWTPYIDFGEWKKKYGPIIRVKLLHYNLIVISDANLAREAYNEPGLSGRPDFKLFNLLAGGNYGVINSSGKLWVEQRRFTLRTLRDYGFGKQTQQMLASEEVQDMVQWFKAQEGTSTLIYNTFDIPTVNSLWSIMTGKRFKSDDPLLTDLLRKSNEVFEDASKNPLVLLFPDLCEKFPRLTGWTKLTQAVSFFEDFVSKPVEKQKAGYNPEDEPQDFVEAYIQEIAKTTDPESSFYKSLGEKNKRVVVIDLFGAGSGTTSTTLSFALMYLCQHPEIQTKLHEEIDRVVGQSRAPTLEDRTDMPYAEAFMYETLRKSSIVPFGVFHYAMETVQVGGYTIPKGSWLAVNQYHIHHDPAVWGDPENFRPERFLSADGKTVVKNDNLIPFSVGKRVCIGEQIAKDGFFLFLTGIMQRFQIEFDPEKEIPKVEPKTPVFILAPPFHIIVKDRLAQ